MLPIKNRLKKREDFAKVFSKGAYTGRGGLGLKYAKNGLLESRIGFPVGKNYSKKAVVRNRAKRVLRAACDELLVGLKPGYDLIVLIKPDYQNIQQKIILEELKRIFQKSNLLI